MRKRSNEIAWIKINSTGSIADVITIWFGGSKLSGDRQVSAEVVDYHIWQGKLLESRLYARALLLWSHVLRAFSYTLLIFPLCCTSLARTVMKSLLRKKTHTDIQKPSPPSTPSIRQPSTVPTPLYARFASAKPGVQPQEKIRPNVSGPMRLGRPSHANSEVDDNRRKREEAALPRHKLSNGRQGIAPSSQPPPSSLPGPRDGQSFVDTPYQDARVNLTQAARQPIKAQTACKSYFPSPIMCSSTLRQRATLGS